MSKELIVSSGRHETKVAILEDDVVVELFHEREKEYSLAGSIHKGRVTRVLPGMQSAFVDIGLERDAFLYVSDFMDLEQQDEDLDEAIPANRPMVEQRPRPGLDAGGPAIHGEGQLADGGSPAGEGAELEAASAEAPGSTAGMTRDFRGRRRRRGRRGETGDRGGRGPSPDRSEIRSEARGEIRSDTGSEVRAEPRGEIRNDRFARGERPGRGGTDSRFQRPAPAARNGRDYDYGPPPGYQPIMLPGESISKYQRQAPNQGQGQGQGQSPAVPSDTVPAEPPAPASINANFPEDEPIFAAEIAEPLHEQHEHVRDAEAYEEVHGNALGAA